jgi:xanthine dehydrogenase molybdopterin-binding subunit B
MALGIPMGLIRVECVSTLTVPNAEATGGSVGSELSVKATLLACQILNDRLKPIRNILKNPTWEQLISQAMQAGVDLQAKGWFNPPNGPNGPQQYNTYAAACSEVEIDVLTGKITFFFLSFFIIFY